MIASWKLAVQSIDILEMYIFSLRIISNHNISEQAFCNLYNERLSTFEKRTWIGHVIKHHCDVLKQI